MAKELLSTVEVAARFQVTRTCVLRWIQRGLLPGAIQIGDSQRATWAIPASTLEGFKPPRPGRRPKRRR